MKSSLVLLLVFCAVKAFGYSETETTWTKPDVSEQETLYPHTETVNEIDTNGKFKQTRCETVWIPDVSGKYRARIRCY